MLSALRVIVLPPVAVTPLYVLLPAMVRPPEPVMVLTIARFDWTCRRSRGVNRTPSAVPKLTVPPVIVPVVGRVAEVVRRHDRAAPIVRVWLFSVRVGATDDDQRS